MFLQFMVAFLFVICMVEEVLLVAAGGTCSMVQGFWRKHGCSVAQAVVNDDLHLQ